MSTLLDETRQLLGPAPRSIVTRDNLVPPSWMKQGDPLRRGYEGWVDLLLNGDLIWGHLVQANATLFRPGNEAAPAQVIYGARSDEDISPDRLRRIAIATIGFKGRNGLAPPLDRVAAALTAETGRHDPFDLPAAITHGVEARLAIVMVHREHLPTRMLSSFFLPLVASSARDAVAILPRRHWGGDLVRGWYGLAATGR
jgi:hypothetical protein